jgi:hypothetical protein
MMLNLFYISKSKEICGRNLKEICNMLHVKLHAKLVGRKKTQCLAREMEPNGKVLFGRNRG